MSHSVEDIKSESRRLRGSLLESLADPVTGALRESDQTLIKYHGSYQQDDRDLRDERRRQKLEPAYQFMIRTRTPGGVVTPEQWLKLDAIATRYANHSLRVTTRQAFQFHGVIKRELKATMQAINAALIDTLAACGDVNRNVLVAANPLLSQAHAQVQAWAARLSEHLLPNTRAYYEIWLDEERVAGSGEEEEPVYGATYLPRKFKIGFAVPPLNDVDLFANDLGFIAILEDGALVGFNLVIGGGMGATHGDAATYPRIGNVIGFLPPEKLLEVATAVVTTQRDFGNRELRKRARFKYTIDDHGLEAIVGQIEARSGYTLQPARAWHFDHNGDRYGWVEGEDGRWHLTLHFFAGRIADTAQATHLTGLREIAGIHRGEFRLTPTRTWSSPVFQPANASASTRWCARMGWTTAAAPAPRWRARRWPASPCPPAVWPWPRPSATCPTSPPAWNRCWIGTACVTRPSCCASPAAPTAARVPTWAKSRWSARRPDATT